MKVLGFTSHETCVFVVVEEAEVLAMTSAPLLDRHKGDNYFIKIDNLFSDWTNPTQNELTMFHLKYGFDFNEISSKF